MIPPISLHGLATTSLLVSLLLAVFLPLRPLLRRAIGSQWLCVLWLALLIRLLLPVSLESRWSLIHRWQDRPAVPAATWKIKVGAADTSDLKSDHVNTPAMPSPGTAVTPPSHLPQNIPGLIWLAGVALGLCTLAWRLRQTRRLAAATLPATDKRLLNIFAAIPGKWRAGVELRMTGALEVPTLAGVFRPQIWMPLSWPAQFTDEELHGILLHELGHACRHDLLVQWLFALAQCLHWFNPLVWLAARAARFDREMACDAWVLARNGTHSEYGSALMKTIQLLRTPLRTLPATVAMASSRGSLRTRISGIGAFRPHPAWRGVAGIFLMIAALASVTTNRSTAQDSPTPANQPVTSEPTPAPDSQSAATLKNPGIQVETRFVEVTEDVWKKLCAENPGFKDYNSKFPELAQKKIAYADLKDHLAQHVKGAWEIPDGEIRQLGVLSKGDLAKTINAFNQDKGVDLLSAPAVVTKDGQSARIEIVRKFAYPTEFEDLRNKDVTTKDGNGNIVHVMFSRVSPTAFVTEDIGTSLEAQPTLNSNGTINLKLVPRVSSFLGFLTEKDGVKKLAYNSTSMTEIIKKPVFSISAGKLAMTLRPGQTILLGSVRLDCDKSDISKITTGLTYPTPAPANTKTETVRHILLVLVTPTIIDLDRPSPSSVSTLTPAPAAPPKDSDIPYGTPVKDKPGFVTSPFSPDAGPVDVRGFPANTEVKDPYTGKTFLVP